MNLEKKLFKAWLRRDYVKFLKSQNPGKLINFFPAFFFALFPKTFKEKYPLAVRNFKHNGKRLTTHYDIYETLKDLADVTSLSNKNIEARSKDLNKKTVDLLPRGISLFLELPDIRTCDSAGIESHWCMCYEKLDLSLTDERVKRSENIFMLKIKIPRFFFSF